MTIWTIEKLKAIEYDELQTKAIEQVIGGAATHFVNPPEIPNHIKNKWGLKWSDSLLEEDGKTYAIFDDNALMLPPAALLTSESSGLKYDYLPVVIDGHMFGDLQPQNGVAKLLYLARVTPSSQELSLWHGIFIPAPWGTLTIALKMAHHRGNTDA